MRNIFTEGRRYKLITQTVVVERGKTKPNLEGGHDDILASGQELLISIEGDDGKTYSFLDQKHRKPEVTVTRVGGMEKFEADFDLQTLIDHFDIPEVADVSEADPERYASYRAILVKMQAFINEHIDYKFAFKKFQIDDYARACMHDGCILAHDPGLGKSIAAIAYSLSKVGVDWLTSKLKKQLTPFKPCLVIAPENLHAQLIREWERRFGFTATHIDSQDTYLAMTRNGKKRLSPGFFITSYTQAGLNKVKEMAVPDATPRDMPSVAGVMHAYGVTLDDAKAFQFDGELEIGANPLIERALACCQHRYVNFSKGVGEFGVEKQNHDCKCIFSPSLVDLFGHEFACVVIDEGVRIKGEATIIGRAVRELDPQYRLVMTATPIKNRLRDIFWLAWWAAGGKEAAHARFPYTDGADQDDQFCSEFNVCERNLTKEMRDRKGKPQTTSRRKKKSRGAPGVEVCNIHRLWKFIAPLVLRRRKADIGEDIVKKAKHIIRTPMGKEQYQVYGYHLNGAYLDRNGKPALMAQLQALRSVAASPNAELLKKLPPECEGERNGIYRSERDYIPKLAAVLNVIAQRMALGEQCVVMSALNEPLDTLSKRLTEAGVPHDVLDGRKSPAWRGARSKEFEQGLPKAKPVLLAGLKAMAEGNNWPLCRNVILNAYDWAWDLFEQGINRVHRLNSPRDVNVWSVICDGTVDIKLESSIDEKGDASELVIDGQLIAEDIEEMTLGDLIKIAHQEYRSAKVYDEAILEKEWPALRGALSLAWQRCRLGITEKSLDIQDSQCHSPVPVATLLQKVQAMELAI